MRRHQTLQIMETKLVVVGPKERNARRLKETRQLLDNLLQACISVRGKYVKCLE
jgi:hypothetical protein